MKRLSFTLLASLLACSSSWATIAEHVARTRTAGLDLVVYPTDVKDVVTIAGSLPAGDAFAEEGNAAVPTLTGMLLDRGTKRRDQFAIAAALEAVGASISFGVDAQTVKIRAKCLRKDLPLVIGLLAEQLRMPAFNDEQFERVRQQFIGSIKGSKEDTDFRAGDLLGRELFPPGHPNHPHSLDEFVHDAGTAKASDVREFYAKHYGPAQLVLVFVGDLDVRVVQTEVGKAFKGWVGGVNVLQAAHAASLSTMNQNAPPQLIQLNGKTSVSVLFGQPTGLRYRDPGALPLRVGTAILGSGFTGRLMSTVRDQEGLTYGIDAQVEDDTFVDGSWQIEASFAPELLAKGIASTRREIQHWWADGITATELENRKQSLIGSFQVGLSTTRGLSAALLAAIQRGYDARWLDDYPQRVQALTVEQVNAAIRQYIDPTRLVLVEAGSVQTAATPPAAR